MSSSKPVVTPMEPRTKTVEPNDASQQPAEDVPYRSAIGSLMYLMVGTRTDIAFAVGKLAHHSQSPLLEHWTAVKRVLRYIAGTRNAGLTYGGSGDVTPTGYTDSDWAGCEATRKSTSGYVFMLGGAPVSWRSKKQELAAASSCEAEYIASFHASKEAIWLKRLLADIHPATRMSAIKVFSDNQGAHAMAYNTAVNDRTKHIAIKYHFTREAVQRKVVWLEYCPT